ncbi:MAG: hypothetical protein PHH22_00335 [Clostridia bacterium]|nr:hypothetical protein [Clostridia bacterium]
MDNASKFIIIIGSVIIILAILSVSIAFVTKSEIFINFFTGKITAAEVVNHNNVYSLYDGSIVGSQIINLANRIVLNNQSPNTIGISMYLYYDTNSFYSITPSDASDLGNIINTISKTKVYQGTTNIDDEGLIVSITFR